MVSGKAMRPYCRLEKTSTREYPTYVIGACRVFGTLISRFSYVR
jgi:hypothetical protein